MVAYRWDKVNTHFSAKVCTLRICTHLQPICDTFFACKNTPKDYLWSATWLLIGKLSIKYLCCTALKLGWYSNKTCTIWCKDLFVFTNYCTIFPSKRAKYCINHLRTCAECIVCLTAKPCNFLWKTCVVFRKFAHFLPIRGCFFDVFALLGGKQMYLAH